MTTRRMRREDEFSPRHDRAVAAYVVGVLEPEPPKGAIALVKRYFALRRWRRSAACREALAALEEFADMHPALAPAFEPATRFFIEMSPNAMSFLFANSKSAREAVLRAVFFMCERLLVSDTRRAASGGLNHAGELTKEALRRASEAFEELRGANTPRDEPILRPRAGSGARGRGYE